MKNKYIKPADTEWEEIQKDIFEKQCIVNKNGINISILKIKPYKKIPAHKHADTRYNYVLKGGMADKNQRYGEGDIIINKKSSKHFLKACSKGCEFLLIWNGAAGST